MPPIKDYASAEAWLLSMTDYERMLGSASLKYNTQTFDLVNFRAQLATLGDPHLRYAVIHVAGTKGKGSTCAMLESALRHCGYRTGLFTSPHLFRFTERIRVDGREISDAEFCRLIEKMSRLMDQSSSAENEGNHERAAGFRTVFEILTASAFEFFAESKVDVALIETGLGGRLDSTNMFDRRGAGPLVDVITAIGLDHTAILGHSIAAITSEKAGIIRPHAQTVVAPQRLPGTQSVVREIVQHHCHDIGAPAAVMVSDRISISDDVQQTDCYEFLLRSGNTSTSTELTSALKTGLRVCPSLHGAHQAANVATTLATLVEFEKKLDESAWPKTPGGNGWPVLDPVSICDGLQNTKWPGRFQVIEGPVPIVIDGAHCAISAGALARACRRQFGDRPAVVIAGFLRDKAGSEMLDSIFRELPIIRATAIVPPTPRAVSADHIREAFAAYLPTDKIDASTRMDEAIARARDEASRHGGYVIIFGSLYLVGPALAVADPK